MNNQTCLNGHWEVLRQDRATGEWLEPLHGDNTILSAGKDAFLDIMFYLGTPAATEQFTEARAQIKIYNSSDGLEQTVNCKSGYPVHDAEDTGIVRYWFEDISADVYEADRVDFLNSTSAVIFSRKDPTSFGTKPNSQNWIYKYRLDITQNGDGDLSMDGLDHALRLFTGERELAKAWNSSRLDLRAQDNGGTPYQIINCDATYPSRSSQTVTAVFTQAAGSGTGQIWYDCIIGGTLPDEGWTVINDTEELLGTKTASTEREYTFTFSL